MSDLAKNTFNRSIWRVAGNHCCDSAEAVNSSSRSPSGHAAFLLSGGCETSIGHRCRWPAESTSPVRGPVERRKCGSQSKMRPGGFRGPGGVSSFGGHAIPCSKPLWASAPDTTFLLCLWLSPYVHSSRWTSQSFTASGVSAGLYFYSVRGKKRDIS